MEKFMPAIKKRKPKVPPMSEARKAIFEANKATPEYMATNHAILCEKLNFFAKDYKIDTAGKTEDEIGNEILTKAFALHHEREEKMVRRHIAGKLYARKFYAIFNRPLSDFYHFSTGLETIELEKCFGDPNSDKSLYDTIKEKYGEGATNLLETIMNPPPADEMRKMNPNQV
jgi:hypothetical protein